MAWSPTPSPSYPVGGGSSSQPPPTIDQDIPATEDRPKIELRGLTPEQLAKVLDFLDRIDNDPKLAAALEQMADRGVTLRIIFADDLPADAHTSAYATVSFPRYVEADFHTQGFQPGSVVTITIERDEIANTNWETTLKGILAHEFTHFYKDANGQFLLDTYFGGTPGNSVQDFDDDVYNALYGTSVSESQSGVVHGSAFAEDGDSGYPTMDAFYGASTSEPLTEIPYV